MSYDIDIAVPVRGVTKPLFLPLNSANPNITWNVRELIFRSSGWDIQNEASNGPIKPWLEKIRHGIAELDMYPEEYKQYESPNGWGTVKGTLRFYRECVKMAEEFLEFYPEFESVAEVWVT